MQRLKHFLWKCKWLLLAAVLIFVGMHIVSIGINDSFHSNAYEAYVMVEYVPAQKRLTGKWPENLNGLPAYVESERIHTRAYYVRERLAIVLDYHLKKYEKIEVIRRDKKSFDYVLYLKGGKIECRSHINDSLK